jgi:hypothetical protein
VDLNNVFYCTLECVPAELQQQLRYQQRALFYVHPSITDEEDGADGEEAN